MKSILFVILLFSANAFAVDVCISRVESQGITKKLLLQCNGKAVVTIATVKEVQGRVGFAKITEAKAIMIKRLIELGYEVQTDNIFVRR